MARRGPNVARRSPRARKTIKCSSGGHSSAHCGQMCPQVGKSTVSSAAGDDPPGNPSVNGLRATEPDPAVVTSARVAHIWQESAGGRTDEVPRGAGEGPGEARTCRRGRPSPAEGRTWSRAGPASATPGNHERRRPRRRRSYCPETRIVEGDRAVLVSLVTPRFAVRRSCDWAHGADGGPDPDADGGLRGG